MGLGIDLVEVDRFSKLLENNQITNSFEKLLQRVLTKSELLAFHQRFSASTDRGVRFLASRYAAKEAFSKAMGCGIGSQFSFQDLSVLNSGNGAPRMEYSPRLTVWLAERSAQANVSISDEKHYVTAIITISKTIP